MLGYDDDNATASRGARSAEAVSAFLTWWRSWLLTNTDPELGVLCPSSNTAAERMQCVGGAMPTHGILLGFDADARLPYFRRADLPPTGRGDAAAATRIFPGDVVATFAARMFRRRVAARLRPRRCYFDEMSRGDAATRKLGRDRVDARRYPERLVDFALSLQSSAGAWSDTAPDALGSLTLDGVFQVTRGAAEALSRRDDARASCERLLDLTAAKVNRWDGFAFANTSHQLPSIVAAAGECARAFPDLLRTDRPWTCCARYV